MLCAIYVRLSKEDQDKQQPESESIQNQKALLLRYARERGWAVYDVYCDEDYSGADSQRPGFRRMLAAAREGAFQIILCKTQSRFTRDMELVEKYIHGLFPLWGVRFIAVADNADTGIKGNKKARQINGLVNEWYLEDLSENVRMVLDMKRREGQYIGAVPLYGYQKDPADRHRLAVDPEAAAVVRQIFRWSLEGLGKQAIAQRLNSLGIASPARYRAEQGQPGRRAADTGPGLWNKTTIGRILRSEMYTGVMVQGRWKKASYKSKAVLATPPEQWYRVEGTHEAIIDPAAFSAVQKALALRSRPSAAGQPHPLSGLVKCMDCGSTMSRTSNGRQGNCYLRCGLYAGGGGRNLCSRHSIRLDQLEELVAQRLRRHIQSCCDPETLELSPRQDIRAESLSRQRGALSARLERDGRALNTLYLDRASGLLSQEQFSQLNQSFLQEKSRLERQLAQLDGELEQLEHTPSPAQRLDRARELLRLDPLPRQLAAALIQKIEIGQRDPSSGRQEVRIHWRF